MGNVWISGGGGAGSGSDECTATKAEVLKGYSAITLDSDDEVVEGTLEFTGDSSDSQVLVGKTYYNTDPKKKRTGTMANQGAINQTLNAGGSYTIPAGYHNGGGKVTANSLASQTPGNADASKIVSGYSGYVNGVKINGSLTIQSIVNFSLAQYASTQIIASWALPSVGPWSGVRVVCKQGGYPANVNDGTLFYEGSGSYHVGAPGLGFWYFRAWNYITTNFRREYGGYVQGAIQNDTITGIQTFTQSGTFVVPNAIRQVNVFLVGGGASTHGCGGGSGRTGTWWNYAVTPGQKIIVNIGGGGSGGGNGGSTSFGGVSVAGGSGWWGGSGGGNVGGSYPRHTYEGRGGDGGYDGRGGGNWKDNYDMAENGQGTTTRAFGEATGTRYAGGGGGSVGHRGDSKWGGGSAIDGGGNGNNQTPYSSNGDAGNGAPNTGGGAGGAGWDEYNDDGDTKNQPLRNGGSGIAIIRWGY
nr:MAG TPA: hypothetical protein [Caudoviricetes sp.]